MSDLTELKKLLLDRQSQLKKDQSKMGVSIATIKSVSFCEGLQFAIDHLERCETES
tara:strand:- start:666 stop:833 length:168 start_codon:yes stop_codon:yes gene_type:complete